jgi:glucose/arabinose dehydrogenase
LQFTANGKITVPGAQSPVDLSFLTLPTGFCVHYFGNVGNTRQMRFAPGGELFVASPTMITTGGGQGGQNAIVVLPDDNHDGVADAPITFLGGTGSSHPLNATQGLMFTPGYFYYQDSVQILRMPYATGDRHPSGASVQVADITYYNSGLHWPKVMDMADDGTIYVGNGGDQGETCVTPHPFHGGIRKIDGSTNGAPVAQGFRNPIAIRCAQGHNLCFALELDLDYSYSQGGREKMVPIRQGDDWGFPCCATKGDAFPASPSGTDCSMVTQDTVGFYIGDTPFGLGFAPATWPSPWSGVAIIANHGAAGSWVGARVTAIDMDATTGLPNPGNDLAMPGSDTGSLHAFATGWDDGTLSHGRPAAVEFSPDGRLFIGNDNSGDILWIAPLDL